MSKLLVTPDGGFYSTSIHIPLICKRLAQTGDGVASRTITQCQRLSSSDLLKSNTYAELPSAHVYLSNDGVSSGRWGELPGPQVPKPAVASCKISDVVSLNGPRSAREIYHKDAWPIAGIAYPKACFDAASAWPQRLSSHGWLTAASRLCELRGKPYEDSPELQQL
jgi:hypothetical protein